jgi:hypothetical protein
MASVKVLLGGECDGGLGALFKKAAAANKKSGPFDALLCIGSGEHRADATTAASTSAPSRPAPPVPTYVLGQAPPGEAAEGGAQEAAEGGPSIHYLGRAGVTRICGLTVAFLFSSEAGCVPARHIGPACHLLNTHAPATQQPTVPCAYQARYLPAAKAAIHPHTLTNTQPLAPGDRLNTATQSATPPVLSDRTCCHVARVLLECRLASCSSRNIACAEQGALSSCRALGSVLQPPSC